MVMMARGLPAAQMRPSHLRSAHAGTQRTLTVLVLRADGLLVTEAPTWRKVRRHLSSSGPLYTSDAADEKAGVDLGGTSGNTNKKIGR